MRLSPTAPALCPGLLVLGRKDERQVNGGNGKIRRRNVRRNEERRERKEKMTSDEEQRARRTRRQADVCSTPVRVDPSIFSAKIEAGIGSIGT